MVRAVVATSEEVREELERERWVPPGKTVVIRDGVNLARFDLQGAEAPARAHWGVAEDAPLVGAVLQGRGSEELALLFDAFGACGGRAARPALDRRHRPHRRDPGRRAGVSAPTATAGLLCRHRTCSASRSRRAPCP
jgi:hypothetical protein